LGFGFPVKRHLLVIPDRRAAASPKSVPPVSEYGFPGSTLRVAPE
jgi:hypothetical protein